MSFTLTIMGCGSSGGVPRIGGVWGACDPSNPKNRRRRCAVLAERQSAGGKTTVLVDTPPDIREQLLDSGVSTLDGVLFTHDHADHTHGIDDLRVPAFNARAMIPAYHDAHTGNVLRERFGYCFETPPGYGYDPFLSSNVVAPGQNFEVAGAGGPIAITAFRQLHGKQESFGYRFGNIAYSPDVSGIPEESVPFLEGLDVWIVDALRPSYHPGHFTVEQALQWIARLRPKRAVLTHMHIDLDYEALKASLPEGVEPAYDGMAIAAE